MGEGDPDGSGSDDPQGRGSRSPAYRPVDSPDESTVFAYHDLRPPETADVYRARRTVREHLPRTPLVRSERLSDEYDADVSLKREDVLPTGSFKVRGAVALLAALDEPFRDRGVVTASTGNFGRAVAWAARRFDVPSVVVVPEGTDRDHVERMERLGARVEVQGADYDRSRERAEDLAGERGYRYVHPGNERRVVAGAGTGGLEIAEARPDVDAVLCPVGAGSLGAGYALSVGAVTDARIIGVQAAGADAVSRAWQTGDLAPQDRADTVADGIAARVPFALPVDVMRDGLDAMYTVDEATIEETVARTFEVERIPIEAASAPPIGLLDRLGDDLAGSTVVVPITGRNITDSEARLIGRTTGDP